MEETYYVQYGLDNTTLDQRSAFQSSGDSSIRNQQYSIMLQNLHPYYVYYFVVTAENIIAPKSTDIFMFNTLEAGEHFPCLLHMHQF